MKKFGIFILALVIVGVIVVFNVFREKEETKEVSIISETSLKEIIQIDELSTFEAVYNGIAEVRNEEELEEVDYYVSYESKVQVGFDFQNSDIKVDHESLEINIKLPPMKINNVNVDITTLDYIFVDDSANTETVSEEAYEACIEDVTQESSVQDDLFILAEQNAKNIIQAITVPLLEAGEETYSLIIE